MSEYKCGHDGEPIIMNESALAYAAYFEWRESVGWDGTRELCFSCWCDLQEKESEAEKNER